MQNHELTQAESVVTPPYSRITRARIRFVNARHYELTSQRNETDGRNNGTGQTVTTVQQTVVWIPGNLTATAPSVQTEFK